MLYKVFFLELSGCVLQNMTGGVWGIDHGSVRRHVGIGSMKTLASCTQVRIYQTANIHPIEWELAKRKENMKTKLDVHLTDVELAFGSSGTVLKYRNP